MTTIYVGVPEPSDLTATLYPIVEMYSQLPDPTANSGAVYIVAQSSGNLFNSNPAGFYLSNGSGWTYLGDITPAYIKSLYESNSNTNAFTDYYKQEVDSLAAGQATAASITVTMNCAVSDQPLAVVVATSTNNTVTSLYGNSYSGLALGIILNKPTSTSCVVQLVGLMSGFSSLEAGQPVFIGTDGIPTTTVPSAGDLQVLGIALSTTALSLNIATTKVTGS